MSGIFGICEPGRELGSEALLPMFGAHVLAAESKREFHAGRSVVMGVAQQNRFQQLAVSQHVTVVADADLVGVAELADKLALTSKAVSGMSVAQLLVCAYSLKGPGFLKLLRGAFSLALWDEKERTLLLAIDRMGIKSLYWRYERDRLLFASRIGGIRAAQGTTAEVNHQAVLQFLLFSAIPAPLTSDRGTAKLCPGTSLIFSPQGISETQYADIEYPESEDRNAGRWAQEVRETIRSSVHRHLEGRQTLDTGCYLSGGTDSSSVVAFASEKLKPVQTFSIAFDDAAFSEMDFARTTANTFGTTHHERVLSPQDAFNAIEKIITHFDEPFANSSAIASYYCARLAREHGVNTLLAGDGGDELFAGNERYAHDKYFAIYQNVPRWVRKGLIEPLVNFLPTGDSKLSLPRKYVSRANIPNPRRIFSYGFFLAQSPESVFEPGFLQVIADSNWLAVPEGHFSRAKSHSELNRLLYLDMKMTLADNDLRKVSGTAELAGISVRYPLLDDDLVDLSGRIPAGLKLKRFQKRYIFKRAMRGLLPSKVLFKKKHGFGVPLGQWLLSDQRMRRLCQEVMHDARTRQRGYFRADFFDRLAKLHADQPNFFGEIVWYVVALELWHRRHAERCQDVIHAS